MKRMRSLGLVGLGLLALGGCGDPSETTDAGGPVDTGMGLPDASTSPVVGTWRRESDYGASSRTLTVTFGADQTLSADEQFDVMSTTTATNAGCSSTITWVGMWSTSGTTLTVSGTSGVVTTTGCNDTTLNRSAEPATPEELGRFGSVSEFTVSGDMLAFTSYFDPAPFTRQ